MLQAKDQLDAAIGEYEAGGPVASRGCGGKQRARRGFGGGGTSGAGSWIFAGGAEGASGLLRRALQLGIGTGADRTISTERRSNFGLALKLQPEDANVEANLGAALAELGRFPEAKSHFERALQIDPNQALAKENLDAVKKEMSAH